MKRFVALLLACCLLVSALSVSVFAGGSILNVAWDTSTPSRTLTIPSGTSSFYFAYSPRRLLSGFGSVPSAISLSAPTSFNLDPSKFFTIPVGSVISYDITVSVSGVNGFGSEKCPMDVSYHMDGPAGVAWRGTLATSNYSSISSGKFIYHISGTSGNALQTLVADGYSCVNFVFEFMSTYYSGKEITVTVESASVRITSLGDSSTVESSTSQVINNINNTIVSNNTEVVNKISTVVGVLNNLFDTTVEINTYLESLVGEINGMGDDLDSVLSYLQNVVNALDYLPRIYNKLDSIGLSDSSIKSLARAIAEGISLQAVDLSAVENYLSNILNQCNHLGDLVQKVADKLQVNIDTLTSILTELVGVGAGVDLCVTYLTGINNSLGILGGTVEEMRGYVETNKQTLLDILSEMQTFDATTKSTLDDVLKNLISQGADLSGMKSYLATIKQNGTEANELLRDLLEELQKVEAANTETNDRLQAIQDALDDFGMNLNQTINNVMTDSDKKGLSGLISKIINHLLSIVDFVGDLFGDIFTSIPSTISAFNDCNSFWEDSKTYVYTPHQLSGYAGQGGVGYENSNESVQKLFAEAEKYLGYPYVFGGSSPETSFDCSGFVCYALNHSGVYTIDRTTAQGLYDACTKIPESEAKPGDLVFFTGTYNSGTPVSHVGIYAGDGKMLHCGDPIQYESINVPYWQTHLYGFGRLPYNFLPPSVTFPYLLSDSSAFTEYALSSDLRFTTLQDWGTDAEKYGLTAVGRLASEATLRFDFTMENVLNYESYEILWYDWNNNRFMSRIYADYNNPFSVSCVWQILDKAGNSSLYPGVFLCVVHTGSGDLYSPMVFVFNDSRSAGSYEDEDPYFANMLNYCSCLYGVSAFDEVFS